MDSPWRPFLAFAHPDAAEEPSSIAHRGASRRNQPRAHAHVRGVPRDDLATWRQLSWTADWHVREECYAHALAGLTDAQCKQPLAAHWGSGTTSSSDAQFFRAGGRGEVNGLINLHYGQEPGVKFYTHLSDQFSPFHTKVIAATANEAPHVLTVCSITRAASSSTSTTPTRAVSRITCLRCADSLAFCSRRGSVISRINGSISCRACRCRLSSPRWWPAS